MVNKILRGRYVAIVEVIQPKSIEYTSHLLAILLHSPPNHGVRLIFDKIQFYQVLPNNYLSSQIELIFCYDKFLDPVIICDPSVEGNNFSLDLCKISAEQFVILINFLFLQLQKSISDLSFQSLNDFLFPMLNSLQHYVIDIFE